MKIKTQKKRKKKSKNHPNERQKGKAEGGKLEQIEPPRRSNEGMEEMEGKREEEKMKGWKKMEGKRKWMKGKKKDRRKIQLRGEKQD